MTSPPPGTSQPSAPAIAAGAALLVWPALLNGYPLVFSDTGTYLSQALHHYLGWDRPPFYSVFLLALHWGVTTWPVVFVQSAIAAWVLDAARRGLAPSLPAPGTPALALILSCGSSLPWICSELMPDVFTGLLVLAMALLALAAERLPRWERHAIAALVWLGAVAHLGHLLLALIIWPALLWLRPRQAPFPSAGVMLGRLGLPLALAIISLLGVNLAGRGTASLAPYGNVFLLARLLDDGPALRTLQRDCPRAAWRLCAYRDRIPSAADDFLWRSDSPMNLAGGPKRISAEAGQIIAAAITEEPFAVLRAAVANTARQAVLCATGDGLQAWPETVSPWIARDFSGFEQRAYAAARQTNGQALLPGWMASLHGAIATAGLCACLLSFPGLRRSNPHLGGAVAAALIAVVANAAITGALSGPHDRYQSRIIWVPVFLAALALWPRLGRCLISLGRRLSGAEQGALWCAAEAACSGGLSFAGALALARLAGAAELGTGAAACALNVLLWVGVNGLFADAIVQRPTLDVAAAAAAARASGIAGAIAAALQLAACGPLLLLLGDARLAPMSVLLAAPLPLVGLAGPIQGVLVRERRYRALAARTVLAQAGGLAAALAVAFQGGGAWALVVQQAGTSAIGAAALLARRPVLPAARGSSGAVREMLRIGLPLACSTLVLHSRYRLFALLVGAVAGPAALGELHMGFRLIETFRELASTALWRLLLPVMSARQSDQDRLMRATDRSVQMIALTLVPLCLALACAIGPLIRLLLGPGWAAAAGAAVPLSLLAGWMFLLLPAGVAAVARGAPHYALRAHAAIAVAAGALVLLFRPATPAGAALAWVAAHAAVAPYMLTRNARVLRCPAWRTLRGALMPLQASSAGRALARRLPLFSAAPPRSPARP